MTGLEVLEKIKSLSKYLRKSSAYDLADELDEVAKIIEKDLEALEIIKENCGLVYEDGNTYFKVNIREYDYLRRPIEDFDKVKHLAERN